ncbi:hypothetical protein ACFV7R_43455 [Streptomyces sp. NPDC059866]|uniref:hypothetical protein n=1 Tax=Streptomyces sp. NPDC059866 TaxID=3346978 RepID=UPI003646A730
MGADDDCPAMTGPAGAEAEARLAEFARHAVFDGQVVTDRALCRSTANIAEQPFMVNCQPLACRNTALRPASLQALTAHLTQKEEALADGERLAPYVCHRLGGQHRETAAFLARHTPEPAP